MITLNYKHYADGQKDWADRLSHHADTKNLFELHEVAFAALERMATLSRETVLFNG